MTRSTSSHATLALALCLAATTGRADETRHGQDALGDWRADQPGLVRRITPADVQAPRPASAAARGSQVVPRPANAAPRLMPGFSIDTYIANLPGARILKTAPNGDIFVAQSGRGQITVLRPSAAGDKVQASQVFAARMNYPYGMAFFPPGDQPQWLYVGTEDKVLRFPYRSGDQAARGAPETVVDQLPVGGHRSRDVAVSLDGQVLYVAIGSGSNVAADMAGKPASLAEWEKVHGLGGAWGSETDRGAVLAFSPTGADRRVVATGLRNCTGLVVHPTSGQLFCATNERDLLGDNTPPDYVTRVQPQAFYGWPWYFIGAHEDGRPGGGPRPDLKDKVTLPDVLIQPHSAPLGLAFNPGGMFPDAWKGDAFVALHGSWNRGSRTGYKVVRLPMRGDALEGSYQDFVTGFALNDDQVWGRPVGVTFARDGALLFSDDGNGVIYRVTYKRP